MRGEYKQNTWYEILKELIEIHFFKNSKWGWEENGNRIGGEKVGDGFDQNTLYEYMKFINNWKKEINNNEGKFLTEVLKAFSLTGIEPQERTHKPVWAWVLLLWWTAWSKAPWISSRVHFISQDYSPSSGEPRQEVKTWSQGRSLKQ